MNMVRRTVLAGLLGAGIGCARSDWVGSTLVTVVSCAHGRSARTGRPGVDRSGAVNALPSDKR